MARSRRPRRTAGRTDRRRTLTAFTAPEHDPLADSRLRPLVERYAALAGVRLDETAPQLLELQLPEAEQAFFAGRERVVVAFTVGALELSPDAEMAVVGSPFVEQLLAALRTRGGRERLGVIPNEEPGEPPAIGVDVVNGKAAQPKLTYARHAVGRLLARVVIRAGAAVEEHLLESRYLDLVTGGPLPAEAAAACVAVEQGMSLATADPVPAKAKRASSRPFNELIDLMVADLQAKLAPRLEKLREESARHLALELERIDSYYHRMLEDAGSARTNLTDDAFADAARAVETEHARRRIEEERRHQVRTAVHPLQLMEAELVVERARWTLTGTGGGRGTLTASRYCVEDPARGWRLRCPTCDAEPAALILSGDTELACPACQPTSHADRSSDSV